MQILPEIYFIATGIPLHISLMWFDDRQVCISFLQPPFDPPLASIVSGTIVAAAIINEVIAVIVAKFAYGQEKSNLFPRKMLT